MLAVGDRCPNCDEAQMPKWGDSLATARMCQNCGWVEEREPVDTNKKG